MNFKKYIVSILTIIAIFGTYVTVFMLLPSETKTMVHNIICGLSVGAWIIKAAIVFASWATERK